MDRKQIEDIYPLSPMQQGMLFDTVYLEGTGIYVERNAIQITGALDTAVFESAWAKVIARHPNLRTLFLWENRDTPLQVVRKEAELTIQHLDWRSFPAGTHQVKLDKFLNDERQNEFDLKKAPLLRLTLIQLAEESYYLAIIFHHIIIDRWSIGLVLKELFALYRAEMRGESLRLPLARPFGDYIGWLQQQDSDKLEEFWRENLAGFTMPTPFNIETSHRPTIGEASYKQAETWLNETHLTQLKAFARQHRLTLNTIVQGAWALLLNRYSGEADVLFGATVAGRPADLPGVEQMVGLFINTLPVRVQIDPTMPLVEWLQALQAQTAVLQQQSHTPLVDVQGWSDIPPGSPLFESIIVFENIPIESMPMDTGIKVSGVGVTVRGQMAYPLTITVNPEDRGRMWLQFTYEQERFEAQAIQRLTEHLKNILENMPDQGQQPVTAVPYLGVAEEAQLLNEFSGAGMVGAVTSQLIHEQIAQQAVRTPNALALATIKAAERPSFFLDAGAEMPQATLTYAELNGRANQLAHHLVKLGVGPEKVVAVQRARSAETIVCLLAVLKAGGVFLPLDPDMPKQRLAHILADARPAAAIIDAASKVDWPGIPAFCPEQIAGQIANYPMHELEQQLTPDNSAYLIYTSGTTGQPKGALVAHRALANHAQAIVKQFELSPVDRVLQFAALSFDVALEEIFPTWLAGAALLLRPLDVPALDEFHQLIASEQLTVVNIPAPYWHEWVAEMARAPFFTVAEALRLVIVGSDKVMVEKLAQWHELMPHRVNLLNGYGPTEATITATLYEANSVPDGLAVVPLGRPIENVTAYVLDGNGRAAPIGVVGELYLGGPGLAHGYLNQPSQTASNFIPNPFSTVPGQRLYRTGDLARWLPDGNLAFIGRTDHQVKIRGFRIELEEIENSLTQNSGVRQAVVVADEHNERLAAYILPDDFSLTAKSLQSWAESKLPDYMVPSSWLLLDSFPISASGKVNRQALPKPSFDNGADAYVAPRREDEETLAAIWSEVLDVEKIGIHDNFFQLGGHSLRATQIVSRMRQQLGWDVPVRAIFEAPTIAGLSARYAPEPITDDEVMAELMEELDGLSDLDLADLESLLEEEELPESHLFHLADSDFAIWRDVAVRGAGFPAHSVLRLALPDCAAAADALADSENAAQAIREEILVILSAQSKALLDRVQTLPAESAAYQQCRAELRQLKKAKKRLSRGDALTEADAAFITPELAQTLQAADQVVESCREKYQQLFVEGRVAVSQALREVGADPRYREAITWQNRHAIHTGIDNLLKTLPENKQNRKTRQREELLAFYMQRYGVKNDTIGFFGPVSWGQIGSNSEAITVEPGDNFLTARKVYFEDWAIQKLADAAANDTLRPWFVPRRLPLFHLEGETLHLPMGSAINISAKQAAVLAACDGKKTSSEIARTLVAETQSNFQNEHAVFAVLHALHKARRITWTFEISTEDAFPENSLRRLLNRIDDPGLREQALQPLNELEAARDVVAAAAGQPDQLDCALAAMNETFSHLTGSSANRRDGEFYAARTIAYEDCRRDVSIEIGPDLIREFEEPFKLLLMSARWYTFEAAKLYRRALQKAFSETLAQFPSKSQSGAVDFSTFWLWVQPLFFGDGRLPTNALEEQFQKRWDAILPLPEGQRRVSFSSAALQARVQELFCAPQSGWQLARYHTPDFMLAAASEADIRRGQCEFVMGEFHIGANGLAASCFYNQHSNPAEMLNNYQTDLPNPRVIALEASGETGQTSRTRFVLNAPDDVWVVFSHDKCPPAEANWVSVGELVVEVVGDELIVRTRDGRYRFDAIEVFARFISAVVLNQFKITSQRDYTPRIAIDKLVVQRESWRIRADEMVFAYESEAERLFLAARQWMQRQGMPRFVFIKTPIEPKPIYVDFASPIYVRIFAKLIRQTAESDLVEPKITISEMYPAHEHLWLTDAAGERYTSELRLVALDTLT